MWSDNKFGEFLLRDNGEELYSMMDTESAWAFINFFREPFMVFNDEGQKTLVDVSTTIYEFDYSSDQVTVARLPAYKIPLAQEYILSKRQTQKEVYSAGGYVQTYWYSDACGSGDYDWSWPGTPSVLNDFEITIGIEDIDYSIRLKTCDDGFKKTAYGWKKRDGREAWYQIKL